MCNGFQPRGYLLVRLPEELDEITNDVAVAPIEEGSGDSDITRTSSTADTVDIVINVRRKIVINDVCNVGNIQTASCDSRSNQNGSAPGPESLKCHLALALGAVTVNRRSGNVVLVEEVGQHIGHPLGLDEDESETFVRGQDIKQVGALVLILNELDPLGDVLRSRADPTDGKEDVVLHEITGENLDITGEGGTEHESLTSLSVWHVFAFYDSTDLGLETHVKHAISFIKDQVTDACEADSTTLDKVNQATRGGAKEVTSAFNLAKLLIDVRTAIDDSWPDPGAVAELASLFVNLTDEFTSGGEDESGGKGFTSATIAALGIGGGRERTIAEQRRKNGE